MLVLGTAQLGSEYGIANRTGQPSAPDAVALIRLAADAGVRALDTARGYGSAETLIGASGVTTPVFTKIAARVDPLRSISASLACLGRDAVEIAFFHDPDVVLKDERGSIDRASELVGNLVGALGASVYTPEQFAAAVEDPRIGAIQAPMSVADRRLVDLGLLNHAQAAGKAVYARSLYLQGALLLGVDELPPYLSVLAPVVDRVRALAAARQTTPRCVLVSFVRDLPAIAGIVLGCETTAQLSDNLNAVGGPPLLDSDRSALEEVSPVEVSALDPRTWPEQVAKRPVDSTKSRVSAPVEVDR